MRKEIIKEKKNKKNPINLKNSSYKNFTANYLCGKTP